MQVKNGVEVLSKLLQDPSLQKSSKACYLLKVEVLQELSAYFRLPTSMLLPDLYKKLCAQGKLIYLKGTSLRKMLQSFC